MVGPGATNSQFLFSRRNSIISDSLSNWRKNARHCSHFPSFRCSTNLAAFTLRNFRQGSRFGEVRRTASTSGDKPSCRFLRVIPVILHQSRWWYTSPMSQEKESPKLTMDQIEMLANFSHASEEYPDLSFEEVARKVARPKAFQGHNEGEAV